MSTRPVRHTPNAGCWGQLSVTLLSMEKTKFTGKQTKLLLQWQPSFKHFTYTPVKEPWNLIFKRMAQITHTADVVLQTFFYISVWWKPRELLVKTKCGRRANIYSQISLRLQIRPWHSTYTLLCIHLYMCMCVCVCVYMCVHTFCT